VDVYECGVAVEEGLGWAVALSASNLLIMISGAKEGRSTGNLRICGSGFCDRPTRFCDLLTGFCHADVDASPRVDWL
jgi:hypothetical protein